MSGKPSHQGPTASRKFLPDVKPLESRLLLSQSQKVSFPDGISIVFPIFMHLPRTGGVSAQTGTVLGIGVGQSTTNMVQVTDDGRGRCPGRMERRTSSIAHRYQVDRHRNRESQDQSDHVQPDGKQDGSHRCCGRHECSDRRRARTRGWAPTECPQDEWSCRSVRLGPDRHRQQAHVRHRGDQQRRRRRCRGGMEWRRRPFIHGGRDDRRRHSERHERPGRTGRCYGLIWSRADSDF